MYQIIYRGPISRCSIPPGKIALYFAGSVIWNMTFPYTVLRVHQEDIITIDKDKQGGFLVSAKIFDKRGDLIVTIKENKFIATYAASHLEKTEHSLKVYDRRGDVAFSVRFTNQYALEISGKIYSFQGAEINSDEKILQIIPTNYLSWGNCIDGGQVNIEVE